MIDVPVGNATEEFSGIVKLVADALEISIILLWSAKTKVYDALDVVVAIVDIGEVIVAPEIVGEVIVAPEIVGEVIVLFVKVWVDVVPTTLPVTP